MLNKLRPSLSRQAAFALVLALVTDLVVFSGGKWLTAGWRHYNMSCAVDAAIPLFAPATVVYLGAFAFWVVGYIVMARAPAAVMHRFFAADMLTRAVCLACFLLWPTTLVRPEVPAGGLWNFLLRLIYFVDAPDGLFPSFHCLISWLCWLGVRGRREISAWYRRFSLIMAAAVCASTLLTKQHVFWDVLAGILLAEAGWAAAAHPRIAEGYGRFLEWCSRRKT